MLTHTDSRGNARMVDVSDKTPTIRTAEAEGWISMQPETFELIMTNGLKKGDVFPAARLAGIMAAKKTSDLIPLCHPLPISSASVDFFPDKESSSIRITATVRVTSRTGVEMEALTAVSVAALTLYDMAKAVEKGMTISGIRLLHKEGGKSGLWTAADKQGTHET